MSDDKGSTSGLLTGLQFALGTFTIVRVGHVEVDRAVARNGILAAPLAGALLGVAAAVVFTVAGLLTGQTLLAAVLAVAALALLTRALHLDGLADMADGLGSGKPAAAALEIMRRSDIGPFGVVTLCLVLLVQVVALSASEMGALALVTACVTGRLAIMWGCRADVPAARPDGLGAMVAGTVGRWAALGVTTLSLLALAALGLLAETDGWTYVMNGSFDRSFPDFSASGEGAAFLEPGLEYSVGVFSFPLPIHLTAPLSLTLPAAALAGLLAAWPVRRRATDRFGGVTGDVLGGLCEVAATAVLLVFAVV
ncbi:adenosylcobinamide-GDP ribazoletransferase [Spongiactinospora rosea]|uniref:Adenosylcobinamide-GDP ribazoletransferase n=1 Tax=Spongiactinospora rosea TaxID=2248750 RepID=A0A366M2E9_9ACTN|nr:adenosylcobinamide-GDP ribazoletransferase [Spongiactinospora rosea]RBQ20207.1 adenosylcobinamide-GDP ribazoletransferase [Spongiactinospora rosea]